MADFTKRPEVTIETMGRVHNPNGDGIRAISSEVQNRTAKLSAYINNSNNNNSNSSSTAEDSGSIPDVPSQKNNHSHHSAASDHETKVKEVGSSKRNITRKKGEGSTQLHNNKGKKQGGGGKNHWNDPFDGADLLPAPDSFDEDDPLYDNHDDKHKYFLSSTHGQDDVISKMNSGYDPVVERVVYGPLLTLSEFKIRLNEAIHEYFDSADADEVIRTIEEMKCKDYHPEVVKRSISLSLDKGPRERELISRLLTCLHPHPLQDSDLESGFETLLNSLDDLIIDIPDAKTIVGNFLARAIVDEVLPPAFISNRNNSHPGDEAIEKAVSLLSREHCTARLEKVWGPGDGRPVSDLKEVVDQIIEEYLLSRELDEAARCIREMNASHFHHELVKRGVKIAMEKDGSDQAQSSSSSLDAVAALFSFLVSNSIISEYQVAKGVTRLHKVLNDLQLDVPAAPTMLKEFEKMAREGGCLATYYK